MKVLIIDDSAVMRNMIKRALQAGGIEAEITEAKDGADGLAKTVENPDIILCDWNMPNMTGLEFVRQFRTSNEETPILMVTTESHFSKQVEAKNAGANNLLRKPFTPQQLAEEINTLIPG